MERKGEGVLGGWDLMLMGPGGRVEYEVTVDFRPKGEQKPF